MTIKNKLTLYIYSLILDLYGGHIQSRDRCFLKVTPVGHELLGKYHVTGYMVLHLRVWEVNFEKI